MKVLTVGTDKNVLKEDSDVARRAVSYAARLQEMHIIVVSERNYAVQKVGENIWVHPTNSVSKLLSVIKIFSISRRLLSRKKEQWLISTQDPFEVGFIGMLISKIYNVPLEAQVHIDFFSPFYKSESIRQRFQAFLAPFVLRRADGIRVVSEKIKEYLVANLGIREERIRVLPIHIDARRLREEKVTVDLHQKYPQYRKIILMASRFVKQKNIPLALRAFKEVSEKYPEVGLVIVGKGPEESVLRMLTNELNIKDKVSFEEWTDNLSAYMKTADVFVLSSNYEGWGMTAVEASIVGLPVIMTDVGCAGEFIKDLHNGIVIPVNSESSLARAIESLLKNDDLRLNISKRAVESEQPFKDFDDYRNNMYEFWKKIVDNYSK